MRTRDLVLQILPGVLEQVDRPAKIIGYSFSNRYADVICTIMPTKSAVNLGIARGAKLPDPRGLLVGTGKLHRHVKLTGIADLKRPGLKPLLKVALRTWKHNSRRTSG